MMATIEKIHIDKLLQLFPSESTEGFELEEQQETQKATSTEQQERHLNS